MRTKITITEDNSKKLVEIVLRELKYDEEVSKMSNKELADYLINNYWHKEKWGTKKCSVIDRVIEILFELDSKKP